MTRFGVGLVPLAAALLLGCASRPPPIHDAYVLQRLSARYADFYPQRADPDEARDVGLLRPRFGLPAIVQVGAAFPLEVLERGGAQPVRAVLLRPEVTDADAVRCLRAPVAGCYPLVLRDVGREPAGPGTAVSFREARPAESDAPPPGGYDLYVSTAVDVPTRVPRAVWLRAEDPAKLESVSLVHLSDLHVGKGKGAKGQALIRRLRAVIGDVNAVAPDLVVITGDIVNRGQDVRLTQQAQGLLRQIEAPVLVIMGNHDLEYRTNPFSRPREDGWPLFARAFHAFREFSVTIGGYDFIGFDTGTAERTPRVLVRGLAPVTVLDLRERVAAAERARRRGVVLFSHAPSRATLGRHLGPRARGFFGRMRSGNAAFESMMLEAAARGQRVLHLAGHTHWSDVFEAGALSGGLGFQHWPAAALSPCPRPIHGMAAIINTQAAAHSGIFLKGTARGYGFSVLQLGDGDPSVAVRRYGVPSPRAGAVPSRCPDPAPVQDAG